MDVIYLVSNLASVRRLSHLPGHHCCHPAVGHQRTRIRRQVRVRHDGRPPLLHAHETLSQEVAAHQWPPEGSQRATGEMSSTSAWAPRRDRTSTGPRSNASATTPAPWPRAFTSVRRGITGHPPHFPSAAPSVAPLGAATQDLRAERPPEPLVPVTVEVLFSDERLGGTELGLRGAHTEPV